MCASPSEPSLPYTGIRVVEFSHMVMGPTCGMLLADLGAEVIKVEPVGGDGTRRLPGSGAGFFAMFNRNKKSIALDLVSTEGRAIALQLIATADVVSENFKEGTMERLGFGEAELQARFPALIYVRHKGFLPGPYEHRTALDEVVQMMGGLAYMTGPEGRPLRAGTSVNDIMGGLFGAMGAMAALRERERTGRGQVVQSALFENNVLLMGTHMMQYALTNAAPKPMPARLSAWAVYDVFTVRDGEQIFLAVVSDTQWALFCETFGFDDLQTDARLAGNADRVAARDWLMPLLRERLASLAAADIADRFARNGLPFAPIATPVDLFDDPHLAASGGLAEVTVPADGSAGRRAVHTRTPLLPLTLGGRRPPVYADPPAIGAHTDALLTTLGYERAEIDGLRARGVVA